MTVLGILALVVSFVPWFVLPDSFINLDVVVDDGFTNVSPSAWDTTVGWVGPTVLFAFGALYLATLPGVVPRRRLALVALPSVVYADMFYLITLILRPRFAGVSLGLERDWGQWASLAVWLAFTAMVLLNVHVTRPVSTAWEPAHRSPYGPPG